MVKKSGVLFAGLCGLCGETIEVAHLVAGGMSPPDWRLRLSLLVAYTAAAGLLYGLGAVVNRRRSLSIAVAGFGMLVVLPWLNLDYLPKWNSVRTVLWTAVAAGLLVAVAPVVTRWPRLATVAVVVFGVLGNVTAVRPNRLRPPTEMVATAGRLSPNVVVVVIDTLRADHLGAYGYSRATSPHFDRLARDSVVFNHAVTQAAWTKPAVASLMTGAFVHQHGVISSRDALGTRLPTLAETLRVHGYLTIAFSANPWVTPEFHFDRGFDSFESGRAMGVQLTNMYRLLVRAERVLRRVGLPSDLAGPIFWMTKEPSLSNARRDEALTQAVVDWLAAPGSAPFFLYVHLMGPHDPYDPPRAYVNPFRDPAWADLPPRTQPPARVQSIFESAEELDRQARANLIAQYDGAVAYADSLLGRIIAALDGARVLDHTLLIVTADHGEEFYEHQNWRHGNQLYEHVVHVPLVMRLPATLTAGRRSDPAMLIDIFPTVVGVLGLSVDVHHLSGRNLFASGGDDRRAVFAEHRRVEGGEYVSRMVYRAGLKLNETRDVARGLERTEVYDINSDPGEQTNLLTDGARRGTNIAELKELLTGFGASVAEAAVPSVEIDRSTKERLRALGY